MNLNRFIIFLMTLTLFACQQNRKKQNTIDKDTQCVDTNSNGICDNRDSDNDGILDEEESKDGTNPNKVDTDGDGASDLCEKINNTDPLNREDFPQDCDNTNDTPTIQDNKPSKMACQMFEAQREQDRWLNETILASTECKEVSVENPGVDENGNPNPSTRRVCVTNWNGYDDGSRAKNYGVKEDADFTLLNVEVTWGVSYKDVIEISNGVMVIKPFFVYYNRTDESWIADDLQFDHQLGALPSTSRYCDYRIHGKAVVKINGVEHTWFQPAFLPFKIPEYENKYIFSYDGIKLVDDKDDDGVALLGTGLNNFSYSTHIVSVENKISSYHKDYNDVCKTRSVKFQIEYFKEKKSEDSDYFEYDYNELENQCKEILGK